jgi:hypothetical protein
MIQGNGCVLYGKKITEEYRVNACVPPTFWSCASIYEITEELHIDWKTMKGIRKIHLLEEFSGTHLGNQKILIVDKITVRKGQTYLTLIADWEAGVILLV